MVREENRVTDAVEVAVVLCLITGSFAILSCFTLIWMNNRDIFKPLTQGWSHWHCTVPLFSSSVWHTKRRQSLLIRVFYELLKGPFWTSLDGKWSRFTPSSTLTGGALLFPFRLFAGSHGPLLYRNHVVHLGPCSFRCIYILKRAHLNVLHLLSHAYESRSFDW